MRVAIYTRISTDEEHQPYSLESQASRLGSYIDSQEGWELVRTFTDTMTGATTERPGLKRMLSEARAARFDLLLVYRVDRFSRSVRGLAQLLEDLDRAGVAFRSATEPFDTTTAAGRMMVQMLGVFAEFERATIVDRVIAGMERKAARGEWAAGGPPFGYRIDAQSGHLVVVEDQAALVPVIFDLYLSRRMGARAVANCSTTGAIAPSTDGPGATPRCSPCWRTAPTRERCSSATPGTPPPIHPWLAPTPSLPSRSCGWAEARIAPSVPQPPPPTCCPGW